MRSRATGLVNRRLRHVNHQADHKVLVVEDDEDLRDGLAYLIERQGHRVVTAHNGVDALARLESMRAPPCLIILDLMMPDMDGWAFRRELLARPELSGIPVLLVSGVADIDEVAQTLKAVDYLKKPVDFPRLYALIDAHC